MYLHKSAAIALLSALAAVLAGCGSDVRGHDDGSGGETEPGVTAVSTSGTGGTGGIPSAAGGAGGAAPACVAIPTDVEAQRVIADPTRGVFYATVAGDAAKYGNSLVVIDAASASVVSSVSLGSQPWTMALSDDASTLWVSLRGSYEIRRVDLTSGTPVPGPQ